MSLFFHWVVILFGQFLQHLPKNELFCGDENLKFTCLTQDENNEVYDCVRQVYVHDMYTI